MRLLVLLLLGGNAYGQAEPAPASYVPPGGRRAETRRELGPRWHLSLGPELAVRLNGSDTARVGYGGGVRLEGAIVRVGAARLGVGGNFSYDSFTSQTLTEKQRIAQAQFAFTLVFDDWVYGGRLRPWGAFG